MAAQFFSTIDPPPPGFEMRVLHQRDLMVEPVVVYVRSLKELEQIRFEFVVRMHGVIAIPGDVYEQIQLAPLLWMITVPERLLPALSELTSLVLSAVRQAANYRENEIEQLTIAERLTREFTEVRTDYNRVTEQLQAQVAELLTAQRTLSKQEAELRKLNDHLEKRVLSRTKELESLNQELKSFCYSVSHDLRAPLRAINGFSAMINEDFADSMAPEARDYLDRIIMASTRMDQLISDMLGLSQANQKELDIKNIDIGLLAREVFHASQHLTGERNIHVICPSGLMAQADERLIRVVLENLIGNAIKFTEGVSQAVIEVGQLPGAADPTFFVRDNGAGFDMENAGKLFAPFQRLHSDREFKGTGIGLATARRVISRHGGKIWAEAKVREGATFYFSLP